MTQSVLNYKTITDAQNVIDGITESVEKEIKKITSDAANTAEMILKNAGSQCARIKEQAVTDADAREKLILQKGSVQAVHLRKRAGFALRQKVYDEIIRKVRSEVIRIKTMNKSLWKDILNRWAVDAVQNLHGHDAVLFLSKDDLDLIDDGFSETLIKMLSGSEKKNTDKNHRGYKSRDDTAG